MTEDREPIEMSTPRAPGNAGAPRVRTLLICDLVDSTALVERLGDIDASELLRRHDRLARDLLHHHNGREIDKTDGFLALFERPIEAVAFALAYQRALRTLGDEEKQLLRARVGVHVGEVVVWENNAVDIAGGAKRLDVEGLAKPVVARLMALALPGQIILSGIAFSLAQRAERELDSPATLRWLTHGRYRFKGVAAPMLVHEVGEVGVAPLQAPPSGAKAEKEVPLWRKPSVIALEAIAVLIAIAVPIVLTLRAPPAIAFAERDWIVMGDLRNLTSEPLLSDALDTAVRVGLEQSRYVNVVPNLQVQEGLRRMEKPGVALDRDIGVQLAAREGARALLLPSLTEIGKNLRFSIEVVDPISGNTVQVESADADSPDGVLPAIDRTLAELRASLGESIKDIEQASAPLARITTGNLEALRTYSQVDSAMGDGKLDEAMALLERAIELDPEFAMARARLGALQIGASQWELGVANHRQALRQVDRLSERERLIIEFGYAHWTAAPQEYEKAALLARLYPDLAAAQHNLGAVLLYAQHEPAEAIPRFEAVTRSGHPRRTESWYLLALSHLMLGALPPAEEALSQARAMRGFAPLSQQVAVDLVQARHDAVLAAVEAQSPGSTVEREVYRQVLRVAVAVDRGQGDDAARLLDEALARPEAESWTRNRARLALARLALNAHSGRWSEAEFADFVQSERGRLDADSERTRRSPELFLAYAALVALHEGADEGADAALDAVEATAGQTSRREVGAILATARCLQRPAAERLSCLDALPRPHWYATDVATWQAARGTNENERASELAGYLIGPKGRGNAIAESEENDLLIVNLLDAARVRGAEGQDVLQRK